MPANGAVLQINRNGPPPVMELKFGDAQWGDYKVYLWDAAGRQPTLVRRGLNNDQIPDVFPIGATVAALASCQLTWQATIGALGAGTQQYSLRVSFTQAGTPLSGTPFVYRGKLDNAKVIADYVKLQVA
jgi:hypothetical protein